MGEYLMGVHLTGVHLMRIHFMDMHLIGMHLMGVYLIGVYFVDVYIFPNPKKALGTTSIPTLKTVVDLSRSELQNTSFCAKR
jgi:hypothetical protein